MKYAISACLCGVNCRYDGLSKPSEKIMELLKEIDCVLFCPEMLGGLSIPRKPCEIIDGKPRDQDGIDYSNEFQIGAKKTLDLLIEANVDVVILKENSPSCGVHFIHNGRFDKGLVLGMGLTTQLLLENKMKVISEREYENWRNSKF